MEEYVVQAGDTLITIAATQLGDATRWTEIAYVNSLPNPNRLLVGQRLNLPARSVGALGDGATATVRIANVHVRAVTEPQRRRIASAETALAQITPQVPASLAPARGYLFVIFEQLPDVGTEKIIRKVAAIPKDFSLQPNAIRGTLTLAEHVLNQNPLASQYVSASDHYCPTIVPVSCRNALHVNEFQPVWRRDDIFS